MFETRKAIEAKLEASEAEVARLEGELSAAQTKVDESAGKDQRIAELEEDLTAAQEALVTETNSHTETKAALETEQAKTTPEAIQALVAAEVAGTGHEALEVEESSPEAELTDAEVLAKYKDASANELKALMRDDPGTYARLRTAADKS